MAFASQPIVGLDIGTSAVRAAVVAKQRGGSALSSFSQVPLPSGAVVDGEVRDPEAVSAVIAQLWKRAKIRSKRVVVGVSNQRVVVRQVDLPFLEEKEFRSSLKFQVADQIPMPVEDAELDFEIIEDFHTDDGDHLMRVLLVAAATDMVDSFLSAVSQAGLEPVGVDLTPFAIARAVSASVRGDEGTPGAEAVVDVGAGVTNIVVHAGGEPRFVRILLVGGEDVTQSLATELGVEPEEAEALKLDLSGSGVGRSDEVMRSRVQALVNEIQGSLDYYSSLEDALHVHSVLVTGGGSLTPGFMQQMQAVSRVEIRRGRPLANLGNKSGLSDDQIAQVEPVAAAAVGLAMGVTGR
jgi:type IV pilus assembly protein PilM